MECNRSLQASAQLQFALVKFPQDMVKSLEDPSKEWSFHLSSDGSYIMCMSDRGGDGRVDLKVKTSREPIEHEYYSIGDRDTVDNDSNSDNDHIQRPQLVCKSATKFSVESVMASTDFDTAAREVKEKTKEAAIEYRKRHTQHAKIGKLMKNAKTPLKNELQAAATINDAQLRASGGKAITPSSHQELTAGTFDQSTTSQGKKKKFPNGKQSKNNSKLSQRSIALAPKWVVIRSISPHIKHEDICIFFEGCKIAKGGIYAVFLDSISCLKVDVYILFESMGGYSLSLQMDGEVMKEAMDRGKVICEQTSIRPVDNLEVSVGKAMGILLQPSMTESVLELSTMIEESFGDIEFDTTHQIREKYKVLFFDDDFIITPDMIQPLNQLNEGNDVRLNVYEYLQKPEDYIRCCDFRNNDIVNPEDIMHGTLKKLEQLEYHSFLHSLEGHMELKCTKNDPIEFDIREYRIQHIMRVFSLYKLVYDRLWMRQVTTTTTTTSINATPRVGKRKGTFTSTF